MWLWLLSIVGVLHHYHFVLFFHLWFRKYWFWFFRFIFCWVTLPGTHAEHSALTWGKPASLSLLRFYCPSVVSFSPVGVSWILLVYFSPHSFWFPLLFGVGVLPPFFPVFLIMSRWFKRTVVLDGSGFAENVKVDEIATKIVGFFGNNNVLSVQFMPGRAIRVTFENESFAANVVREPSVSIDNVVCHVRGGGPRPENVLIFRFPFEADSAPLREELSKYGEVHDIRFRAWTHLDNVMDGARVVRMTRSGPIPRSIHVNDYLCKAWYRGMPITCDICEGSHKAQNCPFKGKCMRCRQEGHVQRDCPNTPNAWCTVGGGPVSGSVDPTPAEAHSADVSSVLTPPVLPQPSAIIAPSSEAAAVVEICHEGFVPIPPSPQSQSILTGLVPPAPGSSIGAFSSSASVLSDPDSIESFATQTDNNDNCSDMDIHGSGSTLSNAGNDNGQSADVSDANDNGLNDNMNIKQSNDNSNLDPSKDIIGSGNQNDINTSNDETGNSVACSHKAVGSGSRVTKSTGARAKSQIPCSSSSSVRSSPRVLSQKARGKHISDAAAVAALSSVSRQVSSSDRRALQRVFSKR